jgi:hypothetical protein
MIFFTYLDNLPSVPDTLLDKITMTDKQYAVLPERTMKDGTVVKNIECNRWNMDSELVDWLDQNICHSDQFGFQVSTSLPGANTHLMHTDSYPRRWVLNYYVDVGGENVQTRFFIEKNQPLIRDALTRSNDLDQLDLLYSVNIKPKRWCLLNGGILHDVVGITGSRKYFSLAISDNNPFVKIPAYKDLLSV